MFWMFMKFTPKHQNIILTAVIHFQLVITEYHNHNNHALHSKAKWSEELILLRLAWVLTHRCELLGVNVTVNW